MAAYKGNIGIMEMIAIQDKANKRQLKKLDRIVKDNDFRAFKKLTKEVLNVSLH